MNIAISGDFRRHVLRREWKSAIQILKAALEIDRSDAVALSQLADLTNRFLTAANPLIQTARLVVKSGDYSAIQEIARQFDSEFPEWCELANADEALWAVWSASRAAAVADVPAEIAQPGDEIIGDVENETANVEKLIKEAQPFLLTGLSVDSLRILERELVKMQQTCAIDSDIAARFGREINRSLESVCVRIRQLEGNTFSHVAAVTTFSIGGLIAAAAICWVLLETAHLNMATDFIHAVSQCTTKLAGSSTYQFIEAVVAALGVSALSCWLFVTTPRLWNREFVLRDAHHVIFIAATVVVFILSMVYAAVGRIEEVAKQDIESWHDRLLGALHGSATVDHYDFGNALEEFRQEHPFLGSRLLGGERGEAPDQRSTSGVDPTAEIEEASNHLTRQARVVLPTVQSDTRFAILVVTVAILLSLSTAMSFIAYGSLKVTS